MKQNLWFSSFSLFLKDPCFSDSHLQLSVLGQVCNLIVSTPDLCLLPYFDRISPADMVLTFKKKNLVLQEYWVLAESRLWLSPSLTSGISKSCYKTSYPYLYHISKFQKSLSSGYCKHLPPRKLGEKKPKEEVE